MAIELQLAKLAAIVESPIALVAFGVVIAAWLVVAWRTRRFKALIQGLEALPEADRRSTIEAEMGEAVPPQLTPVQWMRRQQHKQYFIAFLCSLVALIVIIVSVIYRRDEVIIHPDEAVILERAHRVIELVHERSNDVALWDASMETVKSQVGTLAKFKKQLSQMTAQLVEVPKVRKKVNLEATAVGAVVMFDSETESGMQWREQVNLYYTAGEWKIVYLAVNRLDWVTPKVETYAPATLGGLLSQSDEADEAVGYIPLPGWKVSVAEVSAAPHGESVCDVKVKSKQSEARMLGVYGACDLAVDSKILVLGLASLVDGAARIEQVRFFPL